MEERLTLTPVYGCGHRQNMSRSSSTASAKNGKTEEELKQAAAAEEDNMNRFLHFKKLNQS